MAVTATPIFVQTPRHVCVAISTANTNRDGSGTIGTIFTAGSNGSLVDHIDIVATGTTTVGVVRLYIHNGSAAFLWREFLVSAHPPSTSVMTWTRIVDCTPPENGLYLPSGWSLRASTHNAETFNVHVIGGDL